ANVDALVISKIDLIPYIPFDVEAYTRIVRGINPEIEVFPLSAVSGEGMDRWVDWVRGLSRGKQD
ncbi:MAG: hydrogenase nickel incorporation protein HypB, partial [Chloroflexi bacterium]|nr:hydrogenase nickel incorporation protein HypB [Chloroflexota bacterium]